MKHKIVPSCTSGKLDKNTLTLWNLDKVQNYSTCSWMTNQSTKMGKIKYWNRVASILLEGWINGLLGLYYCSVYGSGLVPNLKRCRGCIYNWASNKLCLQSSSGNVKWDPLVQNYGFEWITRFLEVVLRQNAFNDENKEMKAVWFCVGYCKLQNRYNSLTSPRKSGQFYCSSSKKWFPPDTSMSSQRVITRTRRVFWSFGSPYP